MQISQTNMSAIASGADTGPDLQQMFVRHKDLVFRAAYRITGNAGDAEDVLQTVFLRLVSHGTLPEVGNIPAYLHRSAVNASLDVLRGRKGARTLSLDEDPGYAEAVTAGTAESSAEIREWLRQALARLSPRWAEMFVLRFIEDYSNREIAEMMQTSAAVVAVVLHRTRAQLKKDFKATTTPRRKQ
jgi:RNA polymerase sigma-70 factor (ECF subfamily)